MRETIAIVGNGLIDEGKADKIDTHDRVVRINFFNLAGYEQIVGSRNDIVCNRPSTPVDEHPHLLKNAQECNEIWLMWKLRMCTEHPKTNFMRWVNLFADDKKIMIPDAPFWKQFDSQHDFGEGCGTTTGFVTIHYALYLGYDVSIVGFDGGKSGHYWWPMHVHYREGHNWEYEHKTVREYLKNGLIKEI